MFKNFKSKLWVFLTSQNLGKLIVKYFIKEGYIKTTGGLIKVGETPSMPISLIFWGLYEREDIKFIKKYLPVEITVIECGASLGVTTTQICKKVNSDTFVISIEANPNLYNNLLETKKINHLNNLEIISAAIDYSGNDKIDFSINHSTLSSSKNSTDLNIVVPTVELCDVINKYGISEYSLVCDIEGAEIELILLEESEQVINGCNTIIIELHEISFNNHLYSVDELLKMLSKKFSMKVIDQKERTFVLKKINTSTLL